MKEKIMKEKIKKLFQSKLEFLRGTRFVSFLFIGCSILIAAGILWAANMYYNIDTGEVVTEEIQRVTGVLRATASVIVGGTATQDPTAGYAFEVVGQTKLATTTVATGTLELTAANQLLKFTGGISGYYAGFMAATSATSGQAITYTLPAAKPTSANYVLTSSEAGVWEWKSVSGVGAGDITAVGDIESGAAFTGENGNVLHFEGTDGGAGDILLTGGIAPSSNVTVTIPGVAGTIALGTSTANYVAYWTSTSTLAGTSTLPTSMGGTGQNTSGWTSLLRVESGVWKQLTGTQDQITIWGTGGTTLGSLATLDVPRGGTGAGTFAEGGILYGSGTNALQVTTLGTNYQLLTSQGSTAPTWRNIYDLVNAGSGLSDDNTAPLTLKLGGTLTENTLITQAGYDMIFAVTSTGAFRITDGTNNIFRVTPGGKVLYGANDYAIAESGKEILREMIPILGFDLPVRCATACETATTVSRTIEDNPFSTKFTGTGRIHKFVIRYADSTTTASSTWTVWNVTDSTTTDTFTVPASASTTLAAGKAYITPNVNIPLNSKAWNLRVQVPAGVTIQIYQIFLAAYDKID